MMADNPQNRLSKRRAFALAMTVTVVFCLYATRLFQIQIVEGEAYAKLSESTNAVQIDIAASRGEILDRNLRPIAINETSYTILFDRNYFPYGSDAESQTMQNTCILSLTGLLSSAKESWNDTLPISRTSPYAFEENRDTDIASLKKMLRMADYATAQNCMDALIDRYRLEDYAPADQRTVAGVRYEMEIRGFAVKQPFTFASGISRDTMYKIKENNTQYRGVDVQPVPVRKYVNGDVASHLIGTVGPIYEGEYEELKEKGYALNDTLGRDGIEAAMEDALRGKTGTRTLIKDAKGTVISEEETVSPVPANSVVLTLDMALQEAAQNALDTEIKKLRQGAAGKLKGEDVKSGAVVVLDMTGGVLACATWPNYNLSTYKQHYNELMNNPDKPLFNRALNGVYVFGSTAKPVVALSALMTGKITPTSHINCTRKYTYYDDYQPTCLSRHGSINVITALEKSCNYFFYETGRLTSIDTMNEYFAMFGLGEKTGIEVGESSGTLQSPDTVKAQGGTWYPGDTLRAAIGQLSTVTPIQLATYAMTLGNRGVRYKTHIVHSVQSYDGQEAELVQPEVLARASLNDQAMDTVHEGMVRVVTNGTASRFFRNQTVPYTLAAKTGTAQTVNTKSDHGIFIGYAPAEKPEIAIAVLMEQGTSTGSAEVARMVLDAYFSAKSDGLAPTPEGELLP